MMFRKKCPVCGTRNSKERLTCLECGAPLTYQPANTQPQRMPAKAEASPKTVTAKESPKTVKDKYYGGEKVLFKTSGKARDQRGSLREADIIIIDGSLIVKMEEPVKIPLSHIKEVRVNFQSTFYPEALDEGMEITYLDHRNEKNKLSVYVEQYRQHELQMAIYRQMAGRYFEIDQVRPGDTPFGKFIFNVNESFRDKTRDNFCKGLKALGIEAHMAARGRFEEEIRDFGLHSGGYSLGIIGISEGPIGWVNIRKDTGDTRNDGRIAYNIDYGIADTKLMPGSPQPSFHFGDFQWAGEDFNTGIIDRLNSDDSSKEAFLEGIRIAAIGDYGCWLISKKQPATYAEPLIRSVNFTIDNFSKKQFHKSKKFVPSDSEWHCYQNIARHLLEKWSDEYRGDIQGFE